MKNNVIAVALVVLLVIMALALWPRVKEGKKDVADTIATATPEVHDLTCYEAFVADYPEYKYDDVMCSVAYLSDCACVIYRTTNYDVRPHSYKSNTEMIGRFEFNISKTTL